jgi:hypothetical protein
MFKDTKEGQTHSFGDGCGESEHNSVITPCCVKCRIVLGYKPDQCNSFECECHRPLDPKKCNECQFETQNGHSQDYPQYRHAIYGTPVTCPSSPERKEKKFKIVPSPRIDYCGDCETEHGFECPAPPSLEQRILEEYNRLSGGALTPKGEIDLLKVLCFYRDELLESVEKKIKDVNNKFSLCEDENCGARISCDVANRTIKVFKDALQDLKSELKEI